MKPRDHAALPKFNECISNHLGLNIREKDSESLSKILVARMEMTKHDEPEGYFGFLRSDTRASKQEWKALIPLLTIGESYFFRDRGHFYLLQHIILPELIKAKGGRHTLRIWSAGCSSGEEPYSIAILLDRFFPNLRGWEVLILGTDINEDSLQKARQGIYNDWSFRKIEEDVQHQYFSRDKDVWRIDGRIKKMVTFRYGNLIADDFSAGNAEIGDMDIIVCRNVFIYFKSETVSRVIRHCIPILNEGGYLITGHGELYGNDFPSLQKMLFPEAVIYRKNSGYKKEVAEFKKKTADLRIEKTAIARPAISRPKVKDPSPEAGGRGGKGAAHRDGFDSVLSAARRYANTGDYDRAEKACRLAIQSDALSAEPYHLLAHIAQARGDNENAKVCLKKVIYLDPACIAAYIEISGLYERENDLPRAKKMRSTAIGLLRSLPSHATVQPYDSNVEELLKYVEYLTGVANDTAVSAVRKGVRDR
jgi:chemotaxis protein methyltransferase CheR